MIPPIGSTLSIGALSPSNGLGFTQGIGGVGGATRTPGVAGAGSASGSGDRGFGDMIAGALSSLERTQQTADTYARQAATGTLDRVEDYMVAAADAQLLTQLTVAVRTKAVEAFQEIMRMPV